MGSLSEQIVEFLWNLDLESLSCITRYGVAEEFNINKNYFSIKFKKDTKMTPSEFIDFVKMKRAEELLLQRSDLTISEISRKLGIIKNQHFRNKFKKVFGINPSRYRKLNDT
jgi:two-component system response regulator YesN